MRVSEQESYVLHTRDYRESSQILDVFTCVHGRLSLVARGTRAAGRGRSRMQPFVSYRIGWSGGSDLKTLTRHEEQAHHHLIGIALAAGFYINELLWHLLHQAEPHPQLYAAYEGCLGDLANQQDSQHDTIEVPLRRFEKILLEELGYAMPWDFEAESGLPVASDRHYAFRFGDGFVATAPNTSAPVYSGASLLAMRMDDFTQMQTRRDAKLLFRQVLNQLLEGRQIRSRQLLSTGQAKL